MKYVVIGQVWQGSQPSKLIRTIEYPRAITLIGDDPHGYYSRPGLAYYLSGEITTNCSFHKSRTSSAKFHVNSSKDSSHASLQQATVIYLQNGSSFEYDRLLLATGATCHSIVRPGAKLSGCG